MSLRPKLDTIAFRLLASAIAIAFIILPVSAFFLVSLYRDTVMQLFDESLNKRLEELLTHDRLQALIGRLGTLKRPRRTGGRVREAVITAPRTLDDLNGSQFNLLQDQYHWQVRIEGPGLKMIIISKTLENQVLNFPGQDRGGALSSSLLKGYQYSPIANTDGGFPLLRTIGYVHARAANDVFNAQNFSPLTAGKSSASVTSPVTMTYMVAREVSDVENNIALFRNNLLVAFAILGLTMALAAVLQVGYGLRPLRRMQRKLARVRSGDVETLTGHFPSDIRPLQVEINALIRANREIVERARTQVGNLAHALKTPLSVITNEGRAHEGQLARLVVDQADTMREQIGHYLDRARMAAGVSVIGQVTRVNEVLVPLVRALGKIYKARGIAISSQIAPDLKFRGERQDFEELVGNLLDNACKWAKSQVQLSAAMVPGVDEQGRQKIRFVIDDDGPGLSEAECKLVLQRGKRLDASTPGSGLGLSIVVDFAKMYHGEFKLERSPLGGLRAELVLPATT